jgi:hypothetical protein
MTYEDLPIGLDAQSFAALPAERRTAIIAALLQRGDFQTIKNLGVKIVDSDELKNEPPHVIEITDSE